MSSRNLSKLAGETRTSLDGVKCTPGGLSGQSQTVTAGQILAVATAWEQCAAHFIELAEREDDPIARANSQEAAAANRRHAAQLRELVEAASLALP